MAETPSSAARRPDWRVAVALSLIPGLGQLYNRQGSKAWRLFLGSVGSIGASLWLLLWAIGLGPAVYNRLGIWFLLFALGSIAAFLAGFIGGLFLWGSAVWDAWRSAQAISANQKSPGIIFFHFEQS